MKFARSLVVPSLVYLLSVRVASADTASNGMRERDCSNGGYFLLHKLCGDEAQLPILLDLKTAPKELDDFGDHISRTAKDTLATLDRMRDGDAQINWDHNPLPQVEQDIRASIAGEKQHQLLFGSKGPDFARAMLVSQAEASKYAANIAKVLAGHDEDPDHVRDLKRISSQWEAIYDEVFRLMRNY